MQATNKTAIRLGVLVLLGIGSGCGGGGGGDDDEEPVPTALQWVVPPPISAEPAPGATVTGYFRDGSVSGLDYSSGALLGITGSSGEFQYSAGSTQPAGYPVIPGSQVTFRVGNVDLGTGGGLTFMTPINLSLGTDLLTQAGNKHRFLQMLDIDGNPDNGIVISEAVRAIAVDWPQVDFATTDLESELANIMVQASAADGMTKTLPSVAAANAHFARTFACTYSGLYRGVFSGGGDNGVFAVAVYGSGQMWGGGISNVERSGFLLEKQTALGITLFPAFSAGGVTTGASFSGRFPSPDRIEGGWSNPPGSGSFVGARSGGSSSAVYRISGYSFPLGTSLIMSFEIDTGNLVSGSVIDLDIGDGNGVPVTLTGSIADNSITAAASGNRYTLTGTFDRSVAAANLRFVGTLRDSAKSRDVRLNLRGCRLN